MKVLMITGDKSFRAGHRRFDLQSSQVEKLVPIYWGKGSPCPRVPKGYFDVVTAQDPFWRGLFAWFFARRKRARFNVQVHTDLSAQPFFRYLLAQIVLRQADSIRVVSEKIKRQVEHFGAKGKINILPVYIDVGSFRRLVRRSHDRKTILWVGRFEREKDPGYAIDTLQEVRNLGIDAKLVMLGSGSLAEKLHKRARGLPVCFPGWKDTRPYLEIADLVLCTSLHESWGASIVEALAAGIPVVAPDVGVAREAGAFVVSHKRLAEKVVDALKSGVRGELKLQLIEDSGAWARAWKKTL